MALRPQVLCQGLGAELPPAFPLWSPGLLPPVELPLGLPPNLVCAIKGCFIGGGVAETTILGCICLLRATPSTTTTAAALPSSRMHTSAPQQCRGWGLCLGPFSLKDPVACYRAVVLKPDTGPLMFLRFGD